MVNRLMFGTKVVPAKWQRYITQTLQGIQRACVFFDDIPTHGSNLQEHLERQEVLRRVQAVGLRIKKQRRQFF